MKIGDKYISCFGNGFLTITITEIVNNYWVKVGDKLFSKKQITQNFRKI